MTGRIGLAVYAKNPKTVFALVQSDAGGTSDLDDPYSKAGGVFRSDDAGATWTRQSKLDPRPFYFSQIRVDPTNDKRVYVLGFMLHVSDDGGKTWREDRFKNVHSDNHALAIDPRMPKRMLLGTDGGLYESYDGAAGWAHLNRFAGGEYFRVSTDNSNPYRICGGLQDNTNWVGTEQYAQQGRHSQRGLARDRRRRRLVLRLRSGGLESRVRGVAAGIHLPLRSGERTGQESSSAAHGRTAGVPLSLDVATGRERARQGCAVLRRAIACSSSRTMASSGT